MGTMRAHVFVRVLVLGKERHADLVAAKCYLTNRVAVATSQAVRGKCSLRPTAVSAIRGVENVVFRDFCGYGPPGAFALENLARQSNLVRRAGAQACPAFASRTHEAESRAWHSFDCDMGMYVPDHRVWQDYLTPHLTSAACLCKCSRSEGSLDSQSLFGRLGWLEQTANPSPARQSR
jgi:hypothetical protein